MSNKVLKETKVNWEVRRHIHLPAVVAVAIIANNLFRVILIVACVFLLLNCSSVPRDNSARNDAAHGNDGVEVERETRTVDPKEFHREGAWYKGDLHCHSAHSDGDAPLDEVIRHAEDVGLDFFVVTDHDSSMHGKPTHWHDSAYQSTEMILLYGVEWTSEKGHANIFHTAPYNYSELWRANRNLDAKKAIKVAHELGAYFSINHPKVPSASWHYHVPENTDFIEIWNAPFNFPSNNREAIDSFWEPLLLSGRPIPGVGGSDNHHLHHFQRNFNPHGYPTTWVYAKEPTAEGILSAIKRGNVTLSYSPEADRCEFTADIDGDGAFEVLCGDAVDTSELATSDNVTFRISVVPSCSDSCSEYSRDGAWHWPWYKASVIKNGKVFKETELKEGKTGSITFQDAPKGYSYYRVELHASPWGSPGQDLIHGNTFAVTNPIYFNLPEQEIGR